MSTQDLVAVGVRTDYFYPDPSETTKQAIPTTMNTKYRLAIQNLAGGQQTFTFPPTAGLNGVLLVLQMPSIAAPGDLALTKGWGYQLLNSIQFRVAGSSQYTMTGAQAVQYALAAQPSNTSMDQLLALGGQALSGAALTTTNNYAYCWIQLPYTTPTAYGKRAPLPTDTLVQQCIVQVDIAPLSSVFTSGGAPGAIPTALNTGYFQAQQVAFNHSSDSLSQRVSMATHSLSYPIEFIQQEVAINCANTAAVQSLTVSGLRSGRFKRFEVWLTKGSDVAVGAGVKSPFKWYAPRDLTLLYAGDIYAEYLAGASDVYALTNGVAAPVVSQVQYTVGGGGALTVGAIDQKWATLALAQALAPGEGHAVIVQGKEITSGIITLQFSTPSAAGDWTLHVSPIMESTLVMSQGSSEFTF